MITMEVIAMKNIHFSARASRDGWIKVPVRHRRSIAKAKKIDVSITIPDEKAKPEIDMIEYLLKNPVDFDGRPLTRDQIYDRKCIR